MAKKQSKPETVYQKLARSAQRYGKAFGPKQQPPPPGTATEAEVLREQLDAADAARRQNLVEAAQAAAAEAEQAYATIASTLAALERERGDADRRRNEFAAAASGYDWRVEHKQDRDFIGPFTIEHKPGQSVIKLGTTKVAVRAFASGAELFEAVKAERARLEVAARQIWPEMKEKLLPLQTGPDQTVSWPRVVAALTAEKVPFKKREAAVLFALAWLSSRGLEPGWAVGTRPPTLARQGKKDSVVLPRIERPGSPEKICAIRLDPPAAAVPRE